jgi:Domain of unknown function (DUF4272)
METIAFDANRIRSTSVSKASSLGVKIPIELPVLDSPAQLRTAEEICSRALAMHAVAASAYGADRRTVRGWLRMEGLDPFLTQEEVGYLESSPREAALKFREQIGRFRMQIEGIWALAWVLSRVSELDFNRDCDDNFAEMFPDLGRESGDHFRSLAKLRSGEEIVQFCDLAYRLHWAVRDAQLKHLVQPLKVLPEVTVERRRALEWVIDPETPWEDISLDT